MAREAAQDARARPGRARPAVTAGRRLQWSRPGFLALLASIPLALSGCEIGRPQADVCILNGSQTVEYELRTAIHRWQWFALPTNGDAAVTAGLVMQRGPGKRFPRMGFVLMDSPSGQPPLSTTLAANPDDDYNPNTYGSHNHPQGAQFTYSYDGAADPSPKTDWKVLTLGFNANASAEAPQDVQVPLNTVLIGLRCNEKDWTWPDFPGCRVSLTATLLPFELSHDVQIAAPMARSDAHVFRMRVGDYDSLNVSITRDVSNRTYSPARGLLGAAMLNLGMWARPGPIDFPFNLSMAPLGTDMETYAPETQAMQVYAYKQMRSDKGLLNLRGCATGGIAGCRAQYFAKSTNTGLNPELEKQAFLRSHLWARALGDSGRAYAGIDESILETYVQRTCVGGDADGTYYLTLYADGELSGDGRLVASDDGYRATNSQDEAWEGVDSFGWLKNQNDLGCHCCGGDSGLPPGVCGGDVEPPKPCNTGGNRGELCVNKIMPPSSQRVVRGYILHVTLLAFSSGDVPGDQKMLGCVSYGQWRRYKVATTSVEEGQLSVSLSVPGSDGAQAVAVSGVYAAAGRPPTETDYDLAAHYPLSSLVLTACDVTMATDWHFAVHLGAESAGIPETLFELRLNTTSALAPIAPGVTYSGTACCGGTTNWLVPHVPDDRALSVNLTVHSGAVHGLFLQYDSCPHYTPGDLYASCTGLCEVGWVTRWDRITGVRHSADQFSLAVPMAEEMGESDKRRAGRWYIGVKTLNGEAATYDLALSLAAPRPIKARPYCAGVLDRFCASATQRYAQGSLPLTTAGEARPVGVVLLDSAAPASRRANGAMVAVAAGLAAAALTAYAALSSSGGRRRRTSL